MSGWPRIREIIGLLPLAIVLYLVSKIMFDLLSGRPAFWNAENGFITLLWNGCFVLPFLLFGLAVAKQRQKSGTER
jgi:hypothetical protein